MILYFELPCCYRFTSLAYPGKLQAQYTADYIKNT
jgi:hypothetical protein